jgi:hypothetical protein
VGLPRKALLSHLPQPISGLLAKSRLSARNFIVGFSHTVSGRLTASLLSLFLEQRGPIQGQGQGMGTRLQGQGDDNELLSTGGHVIRHSGALGTGLA